MSELHPCSSYQSGNICRDGFIQRPFCRDGDPNTSPKYLPYCLRDELPDHYVTESGRPAFRLTATPAQRGSEEVT